MDISKGLPKSVESVLETEKPKVGERKVVVTITGIRPDFIRMAFVFKALDAHPAIRHVMLHTGQHYDELLSGSFFKELGLRPPDHTLACGTSSKNHYEQLAYLSTALLEWLKESKLNPDLILFLGDSNSVTAALPLKKEGYTIGHIEAGMRSHDRRMLEEINRTVCDVCSDLFFVYHEDYKTHLLNEGVDETKRPVHVVGNTVVEPAQKIISLLGLFDRPKTQDFILMDIHRPENFLYKERLQAIFDFGSWLAEAYGLPISCLAYGRLRKCVDEWSIDLGKVVLTDLLPFPAYLTKVYDAKVLISDSGTGQEEPALLKTPVVVPRDFSERPQSYAGNCSVRLAVEAENKGKEWQAVKEWTDAYLGGLLKVSTEWLGDGNTSARIICGIQEFLKCPASGPCQEPEETPRGN